MSAAAPPDAAEPTEQGSDRKTAEIETGKAGTQLRVGVLLFPEFEMLDVFGPVEMLAALNHFNRPTQVVMIAVETSRPLETPAGGECADAARKYLIKSSFGPEIAADATLDTCAPLDMLLVPGGIGVRQQVRNTALQQWIRRCTGVDPTESAGGGDQPLRTRKVLAICSGVALLSAAGCLDNKRATTSRRSREWVQRVTRPRPVQWQSNEGSVEDGIFCCSPGVADAMDAALRWIADIHEESIAVQVSELIEYRRGTSRAVQNQKGPSTAQATTDVVADADADDDQEQKQEEVDATKCDSSSATQGAGKMNRAVKRLVLLNRVVRAFQIEDTREKGEPDPTHNLRPESGRAMSWRGRNPLMPHEFDPAPRNAEGASEVSNAFHDAVGGRTTSSPVPGSATATGVGRKALKRRSSAKRWRGALTKINSVRQFQETAKPGLHSKLAKVLIEAKVDDKGEGTVSLRRSVSDRLMQTQVAHTSDQPRDGRSSDNDADEGEGDVAGEIAGRQRHLSPGLSESSRQPMW